MQLSLTPILLAIELSFLLVLVRRYAGTAPAGPVHAYWLWIAAYALATTALGARGVYIAEGLLRWLPGLWLPVVTVARWGGSASGAAGARSDVARATAMGRR